MSFKRILNDEKSKRKEAEETKACEKVFDNEYHTYIAPFSFRHPEFTTVKRAKNSVSNYIVRILYFLLTAILFIMNIFTSDIPNSPLPKREIKKEKIVSAFEIPYIYDNANFVQKENPLLREMKKFYKKTGVQPVLITAAYDKKYDAVEERIRFITDCAKELDKDERHFLIIYFEGKNDRPMSHSGNIRVLSGNEAKKIFDSSVLDDFNSCIDNYSSLPLDKMIAYSLKALRRSIV